MILTSKLLDGLQLEPYTLILDFATTVMMALLVRLTLLAMEFVLEDSSLVLLLPQPQVDLETSPLLEQAVPLEKADPSAVTP